MIQYSVQQISSLHLFWNPLWNLTGIRQQSTSNRKKCGCLLNHRCLQCGVIVEPSRWHAVSHVVAIASLGVTTSRSPLPSLSCRGRIVDVTNTWISCAVESTCPTATIRRCRVLCCWCFGFSSVARCCMWWARCLHISGFVV